MRAWFKEWGTPLLAALALVVVLRREWQPERPAAVRPAARITSLLVGKVQEARRLAAFYRIWADLLETAPDAVRSTRHFRDAYVLSGKLAFPPGSLDAVPGLADAVDARLQDGIGLDVRPLSPEVKARLTDTLRRIAAECADAA